MTEIKLQRRTLELIIKGEKTEKNNSSRQKLITNIRIMALVMVFCD